MAKIKGTNKKNILVGTSTNDTILGLGGNDVLKGGSGNDKLDGGKGNDRLEGGKGDDKLKGGVGKDKLLGGPGDDTLRPGDDLVGDLVNGGSGLDTVDYSGNAIGVLVSLPDNNIGGGAIGDTFVGIENVIGTEHADVLRGSNGGFSFGRGGDDQLYGTGGFDGFSSSPTPGGILRGDGGIDELHLEYGYTFAWLQRSTSDHDNIMGFHEGSDALFIKLSDWGLGTSLEASEVANFGVDAPTFNPRFMFRWFESSGALFFDANGDGVLPSTELVASFSFSVFDEAFGPARLDAGDFFFLP